VHLELKNNLMHCTSTKAASTQWLRLLVCYGGVAGSIPPSPIRRLNFAGAFGRVMAGRLDQATPAETTCCLVQNATIFPKRGGDAVVTRACLSF